MVFVYDEAGHLIGEYRKDGTRIREYVWMDDTPVAVFNGAVSSSTTHYLLTDHLNTPRAAVSATSNVITWRWDITPTVFGEHAAATDPDGDGNGLTINLRYPGQYFDTDTGLHQNYFRDYDPATGRYFQSDPIGLAGGLSTFAYVSGRPYGLVDALGLDGTEYRPSPEVRPQPAPAPASTPAPHQTPTPGSTPRRGSPWNPVAACAAHPYVCGLAMCVLPANMFDDRGKCSGDPFGEDPICRTDSQQQCFNRYDRESGNCNYWIGRGPRDDPNRWYRACLDRAAERRNLCYRNNGPDDAEPPEWSDRDLR